MKSAYCPSKGRLVTAEEYARNGFSGFRYVCSECRKEVRFRNWHNSPPYFAHIRYNPNCSLSMKGDGLFFLSRDRSGDPVGRVDPEILLEGISMDIVTGAIEALYSTGNTKARAAGASILLLAAEFGDEWAEDTVQQRFGDRRYDMTT